MFIVGNGVLDVPIYHHERRITMIYCISDIHGELDKYKAMLELINLTDEDTLYVLGDVADRKAHGVDILLDIMSRPNVKMLLGNHDNFILGDLLYHEEGVRERWQRNGGSVTRNDLVYKRPRKELNKILRFLRDLPDHIELEVNGRKFYLVHGYPADNTWDRIWKRPDPEASAPIEGVTAVIGHTPTVFLGVDPDKPVVIWHGNGVICIDCGCGNESDLRRLACLRLDDMAEFYV